MNELSPKEIYEQKKKEKVGLEKKLEKFGKFKKLLFWFLVILVISGGIYWLTNREKTEVTERKIYAIAVEDQGRNHIDVGASHPTYNSNPPTSGWHYGEWESKGVYKEQQPDEGLVHNLEHGYIWISYSPDAAPEIIKQLESFYGFGKKIIVEPRKENDKLIALAAWNWLDKFDPVRSQAPKASADTQAYRTSNGVDPGVSLTSEELKRIQDFIDAYMNHGPEPNAP